MLFPDLWRGSGRRPQGYGFHTASSRARSGLAADFLHDQQEMKCTNLAASWHRSTGHFSSFVGDLQPSKSSSIHASPVPLCLNTSRQGSCALEEE